MLVIDVLNLNITSVTTLAHSDVMVSILDKNNSYNLNANICSREASFYLLDSHTQK